MVRVACSQSLGESIQSFAIKYGISCGFFINPLYQVVEVHLHSWEFLSWVGVEFFKWLFFIYYIIIFSPSFTLLIWWNTSIGFKCKSNFAFWMNLRHGVLPFSYVARVCFCVCVHKGCWSLVLFSYIVFGLNIRAKLAS